MGANSFPIRVNPSSHNFDRVSSSETTERISIHVRERFLTLQGNRVAWLQEIFNATRQLRHMDAREILTLQGD